MLPFTAMEYLVHDHRRQLLDDAARQRLIRECRAMDPSRRRRRLGWLLVRAGVRLAGASSSGPGGAVRSASGNSPIRVTREVRPPAGLLRKATSSVKGLTSGSRS